MTTYSQPFGAASCRSKTAFLICSWESACVDSWLYVGFYTILYEGLEHLRIWVFTGSPGSKFLQDTKGLIQHVICGYMCGDGEEGGYLRLLHCSRVNCLLWGRSLLRPPGPLLWSFAVMISPPWCCEQWRLGTRRGLLLACTTPQQVDAVLWAEGGDRRGAETYGARLVVSWENSDKNFSQVL